MLRVEDGEMRQIGCRQRHLAEPFRLGAHKTHKPASRAVGLYGLDSHRLAEE